MLGEETLEINIPAGVEDGMQLSMRGKGHKGRNNGGSGDLIVNIEEKQHEDFVRDGKNIVFETNLNFSDMVLGTDITVPTIKGKVKINIPAGTPAGKIFRLKGKGLSVLNSYERGDQLIHVNVWIPKKVSAEETEILKKLKSSQNFEPGEKQKGRGFFERMKEFFD
jgi:molecular chaperone DnaJ